MASLPAMNLKTLKTIPDLEKALRDKRIKVYADPPADGETPRFNVTVAGTGTSTFSQLEATTYEHALREAWAVYGG